ncbi:MAG: Gfo/Idh/MocA family protein [Bacteroidota bacterium]
MSKILKVGVIGLGVGEKHAETYLANKNCKLIAVADFDELKLKKFQSKTSDLKYVSVNADTILADPEIDLVSIASFDNFHASQIIAAISAGKHIFVEKPLCLHDEEYNAIKIALAENPQIKLSSNLVLRCAPHFKGIKEKLNSGFFGKPYYFEGDYNYGRIHKIVNSWRGEIPFYSVVHGGAIHLTDLIMWLVQSRVTEVAAVGNRIMTEGTKFKFPDMVSALLKFENGITGKVSANFGCVMPHHHALSVFGSEASYIKGFQTEQYYSSREGDGNRLNRIYEEKFAKTEMLESFIACILNNNNAPLVTAIDVLDSMAVSLAIERSLKSNHWEKVTY